MDTWESLEEAIDYYGNTKWHDGYNDTYSYDGGSNGIFDEPDRLVARAKAIAAREREQDIIAGFLGGLEALNEVCAGSKCTSCILDRYNICNDSPFEYDIDKYARMLGLMLDD